MSPNQRLFDGEGAVLLEWLPVGPRSDRDQGHEFDCGVNGIGRGRSSGAARKLGFRHRERTV